MTNTRLLFLFVGVLATVPVYAESYLCVGEMATGFLFHKDKREWITGTLKAEDKYVLTRNSEKPGWTLRLVGSSSTQSICDDFSEHGILRCDGRIQFHMNRANLRFLAPP